MITEIDQDFVERCNLDQSDIGKFAIVVAGCITVRDSYASAKALLDYLNADDDKLDSILDIRND